MVVLTHGKSCYRRGCRCPIGKAHEAQRKREARARKRRPCDVCRRIHPGQRCTPEDLRTVDLSATIPRTLKQRLEDAIPWGERSAWLAALIEAELDRLDAEDRAA